jgi:serine/threonine protein kinase/Tfp pilus assembly protein PilF
LDSNSELCPVCALNIALESESHATSSELRFEHYQILKNADGTPIELGHGAMGVTYKAIDVHLQCAVALKIINAQLIGDTSARHRFVREARAAASVHHQNVASVFHLGESGGNYFYVMEFVDGETLERLIRSSGKLEVNLALEVVSQVAAGLTAIQKHHLVHRDVKPSNIMVTLEEGRLESVKIIDLGLAKGVAEQETISAVGSFTGTPGYASPEQFAGLGVDIRSDLYSLGITLWEMLLGRPPFRGSATELMYQHQHTAVPFEQLKGVPAPIVALLNILLEKDPSRRFQGPLQLQRALAKVKEAVVSGLRLSASELRTIANQTTDQSPRRPRRKRIARWLIASTVSATALLLGWFFFVANRGPFFNWRSADSAATERSIAVLPFESLSENKRDTYFTDGVHDEILNNLAKIAQLKVISRTSVMQYRPDVKRDLRQIANTLGVAYILEGTVRRSGNYVRISTDLVNARNDHTVWADSYDRDLTDIFAIQSEIAQAIASKLTAALSPEEKKRIETRPTDNLEAYDLYLQANKLILNSYVVGVLGAGMIDKTLNEAISLLDQAVRLDPKFTLAYCASVKANAQAYEFGDRTPERRAAADAAIKGALELQPDLPEVHLAYTLYLYWIYRDYERARVQLDMARRSLPNSVEAFLLAGYMDRRQGKWDKALEEFNEAIARDPRNPKSVYEVAETLFDLRHFSAAEQAFDLLIEVMPDQSMLKVRKADWLQAKNGDRTPLRLALAALPASMANDTSVLCYRLRFALDSSDWQQAKQLIERLGDSEDDGGFGTTYASVSVGCYSILLARLQGEQVTTNPAFAQTRQQLVEKVNRLPENARLIAKLGLVDALLDNKKEAISEAKHATGMLPVSRDALHGPGVALNLAVVYAWTNDLDLAFETLDPLTRTPNGLYYGDLKNSSLYEPLRKDPRYQKLLAELAPKD